jgi:hypothetical protein
VAIPRTSASLTPFSLTCWLADRPEDQYFVELRQDLFGSIEEDEGGFEGGFQFPLHSLAFQLFPFFLVAGLGVTWYVKKMKRHKTGRHKKIDL